MFDDVYKVISFTKTITVPNINIYFDYSQAYNEHNPNENPQLFSLQKNRECNIDQQENAKISYDQYPMFGPDFGFVK